VSRPFKFYLLKLLSHLGSLLVGALLFLEHRLLADKVRIYTQALGVDKATVFLAYTQVRDKKQSLCQLPHGASW